MQIAEIILPVFLLILLGVFLRKVGLMPDGGIVTIKKLCVNVFLPVQAFNVLINGKFSSSSFLLMGLMVFVLFIALGSGYLVKPFFSKKFAGYIPFAITSFEGGMFGWALVSIAAGENNLFYIVPMDIVNGIFGFTVMSACLKMLNGSVMTKKEIALSICKSPLIIAVILGFIGCAIGLGDKIKVSTFCNLYSKTVNWLTAPLSSMILICIGATLSFKPNILLQAFKLAVIRYMIMGVLCFFVIFIVSAFSDITPILRIALLVYFFVPTSFLLSMFTEEKETSEFLSSFLSVEIVISLIIFSILVLIQQV